MYFESRQPALRPVTVSDAEGFLALNVFPGQRKYNPVIGRAYARNMALGTHRRIEIAVAKVKENGRDFLMNGQHNCQALLLHGKPYNGIINYYVCDTMEDAWRLFATFDVHRSRTEQQFIASRRGLFSDERLHDVHLRCLGSASTALIFLHPANIGNGEDQTKNLKPRFIRTTGRPKTERSDLIERYPDDVLFVARYQADGWLMTIGVATAMIGTRRKDERGAIAFWDKVRSGEMMTRSDPRMRLREYLLDGSRVTKTGGDSRRVEGTYSACVLWWNTWRSGDHRKILRIGAMKEIPDIA